MRISAIHVYQIDLPVIGGPFRMASTTVDSMDSTVVEVVTDSGITGYGETCPVGPVYQPQHALGARAGLQEMAAGLIGQNPLQLELIRACMERALNGTRYAKAALDIACWDILGKAYGTRVCDLLGGPFRELVDSYYSIGVMPADQAAEMAREKMGQGFRRLQLKVGGRSLEEDVAAIRKVSECLKSDVTLVVDGNRGWTTRDARMVSLQCMDLPLVLEQPCFSYEEIAALKGQVVHPVFLDEGAEDLGVVLRAIGDRAVDGFALKCTRVGGISAMRTIRDVCRASRLPLSCDDSWGGDIIAAACTHLGATVEPGLFEGAWIAAPYIQGHYDPDNGIQLQDGKITLPKGPGLGIVPEVSQWGDPVMSFG
jgi:L-alanine-DL-glutamate epimerase-like enolase superfamily enzyme